ncbi:MAG: TGS domain-containing protein [Planctomycetaceae bacterium]|nr:TGS domain-containing protein [Planctomycetaceae bacterium]
MPANLTPQYQKAETEYRRAQTAAEKVVCLELMLKLIPKHKGTEKLQADLKTRLKETREDVQTEAKAPKGGKTFKFPRQGAGTIVILGGPNAGKSRLLQELTNAEPNVAEYPFSTHEPMPGMMKWEDVTLQLIDTPPIASGHVEPYLTGFVRSADAVVLCFDGSGDDAPEQTAEVLQLLADRKTRLAGETGLSEEDLGVVLVKTLLVVTRGDDPDAEARLELLRELTEVPFPILRVDFDRAESREALRTAIYNLLDVMRVYTKKPGKPAEYQSPFTIRIGGTVEELAAEVHRDLAESLKHARVWGESAHDGQTVGRDHVLADRDMVELHA